MNDEEARAAPDWVFRVLHSVRYDMTIQIGRMPLCSIGTRGQVKFGAIVLSATATSIR